MKFLMKIIRTVSSGVKNDKKWEDVTKTVQNTKTYKENERAMNYFVWIFLKNKAVKKYVYSRVSLFDLTRRSGDDRRLEK